MTPKSTTLFTRSLLGAVLVFFLMPFMTLTCGGAKLITMNGVQLATGTTLESKQPFSGTSKKEQIKPEPLAAIAAIVAIATLGLAFVGGQFGKISSRIGAGACALSLLAMKFKVEDNLLKEGKGVVGLQWEFGFWLALLASIAVVVISFLPNKDAPSRL